MLERHNLPGGSATSFVRGRFEFESALHELCDLDTEERPGTVRKLFDQYGAKMKWHLEQNLFHLIVPGKTDLVLPSGIDPFAKKMEELVPGCEASVRELLRLGALAAEAQAYAMSPKHNNLVMMTKYADFLRLASVTTREGFEAIQMPKAAQDILNTYWCYLGAPPDYLDFLTTAQMVYKYVYYKPGQPDKKSHNLSLTLVDVIRKHGGVVWFNCEVEQILFEKDRAVGVLVHGKKLYARYIIANCLNVIIPESSPKGTCTLFFTTFGDYKEWANLAPKDYYKKKEQRMKDWVDYYEKTTGVVIRPYIEEITFASPATFCRYLNTPNGTPYGYQVYKWDNIINRLNSMDDEQMFKGLRLTGAACENIDGYNLCYLNGNIQGKKTLKDAEEEQ